MDCDFEFIVPKSNMKLQIEKIIGVFNLFSIFSLPTHLIANTYVLFSISCASV